MKEVVVVSIGRTPMGAFGGAFKGLSAIELGVAAVKGAFSRTKLTPEEVQDVYFGNVVSANLGQAPAKQVSLGSGIPSSVPCTTINKVCASGMKAIELGAANIALGHSDVVLAGGMESMSNIPRYAPNTRFIDKQYGLKYGNLKPTEENHDLRNISKEGLIDGLAFDGLSDPYTFDSMGTFGVLAAVRHRISREEIDEFTLRSYQNTLKAHSEGKFKQEIVKVNGKDLDGDEEALVRGSKITAESLAGLKPAFPLPKKYSEWSKDDFEKDSGIQYSDEEEFNQLKKSITVASSSPMSDGAAALVLASKEYCEKNGIDYLCSIKGWGQASQKPEDFTTTPALAAEKALKMANTSVDNVDFFEVNEAFAIVPLLFANKLNVDWKKKVNVYGGACAMGHPIGCSGARITATLISAMLQEGGNIGCASICNGGGGASALVLERNQTRSKL